MRLKKTASSTYNCILLLCLEQNGRCERIHFLYGSRVTWRELWPPSTQCFGYGGTYKSLFVWLLFEQTWPQGNWTCLTKIAWQTKFIAGLGKLRTKRKAKSFHSPQPACWPLLASANLPGLGPDPVQGGWHVSSCQPSLLIRKHKHDFWYVCTLLGWCNRLKPAECAVRITLWSSFVMWYITLGTSKVEN